MRTSAQQGALNPVKNLSTSDEVLGFTEPQAAVSLLDTTRQIEIPEGVELTVAVAGVMARALAFILDLLIRAAAITVISMILAYLGDFGNGILLIIIFLTEWFYPVLFEVLNQGQTLGKKALGILVINDDGTPINWSSSVVRNLLRFADFLPFSYGFGLLSMLLNHDFKRLGDLAAGTLVVYKKQAALKMESIEMQGLAPRLPLLLDEQSAIMSFDERSRLMSSERRQELANILNPWMRMESTKEVAANQLKRMAKWLRGR